MTGQKEVILSKILVSRKLSTANDTVVFNKSAMYDISFFFEKTLLFEFIRQISLSDSFDKISANN